MIAVADRYVTALADLDPCWATLRGVAGQDHRLPDLSPHGLGERERLLRRTRRELAHATPSDERDRRAAAFLADRLDAQLDLVEQGEPFRPLRVIGSPLGAVRQVFDLMRRESHDDWEVVATRLEAVPATLVGFRQTLDEGLRRGIRAARRQALALADQAATWAGRGDTAPFFTGMVATADVAGTLRARLEQGARRADEAMEVTATFLFDDYAPRAPDDDPVGPDRYAAFARHALGTRLDPDETYAWGWEELGRLDRELASVAEAIHPGGSVEDARVALDADEAGAIEGVEAFRSWLQDLMDRTVEQLAGTHFDIPEQIRRVEAMIAPPGGAAAMYYTPPSEDFTRPGRTWYPTLGKTRFPLWPEVTTAFHEGVPGHHLQLGQVRVLGDRVSRHQRLDMVSGHIEGWALYAERLMDELGAFDTPATRFGFLTSQRFRAARVVIDLGLHLQLGVPAGAGLPAGATWTPEMALAFLEPRSPFGPAFAASEIDRYLGLPAQAISYKVGERVWLDVRERVRRERGSAFSLRRFHAEALDLGNVTLDQLAVELVDVPGVSADPG